jgi:hypothetical protein
MLQNNYLQVLVAIVILCLAPGCVSARRGVDVGRLGLQYQLREVTDPRPNRIHILRVDLGRGKVRPVVVLPADPDGEGPGEVALTNPLKLAANPAVLAFVNTNPWDSLPDAAGKRNRAWFEGQVVNIEGLAATHGQLRSPPEKASIWIAADGRVHIGDKPDPAEVVEGLAGFQPIVKDGALAASPDEVRHPRTALGTERGGRILWLVVVDGRQKGYSEGMSLYELAEVMRGLGCQEAVNLDGGGSSIMGLVGQDGLLQIMNSPSDLAGGAHRIRPLPAILTLQKTR